MQLNTVLLQPRVVAQRVSHIRDDLGDGDDQLLPLAIGHLPSILEGVDGVRRHHPVERLGGIAIGVDGKRPIRLHHDQPNRLGEVGGDTPRVVDRAACDDQSQTWARVPVRCIRPATTALTENNVRTMSQPGV